MGRKSNTRVVVDHLQVIALTVLVIPPRLWPYLRAGSRVRWPQGRGALIVSILMPGVLFARICRHMSVNTILGAINAYLPNYYLPSNLKRRIETFVVE